MKGLAFIAGVDRVLDMARTVVKVIGNSLASIVMSKWEGRFDEQKQGYVKSLDSHEQTNVA
jgi:proton glutamate symport protein